MCRPSRLPNAPVASGASDASDASTQSTVACASEATQSSGADQPWPPVTLCGASVCRFHLPPTAQAHLRKLNKQRGGLQVDKGPDAHERRAHAQLMLGYLHLDGEGCKRDNVRACSHLRAAADLGNAEASSQLGSLYNTGQFGS